jgi:glycosyltransferase involved in cell wall biosynthesis
MNKKSIYVSIPSLPDKELYFTIHKCLTMAKNPKNIYIGIAYYNDLDSEIDPYEVIKSFNNSNINIKVYDINDEKNRGIGVGRNDAKQFYKGQSYFLQVDSHTNFEKNWDKKMIRFYKKALKMYGECVLTACLPKYRRIEDNIEKLDSFSRYPIYDGFRPESPMVPSIENTYLKTLKDTEYAIKVSASMIFGYGYLMVEEQVPRWANFWEEEVIQSINIFKKNIKIIFLQHAPMQHLDNHCITPGLNDRKIMSSYFSEEEEFRRISSTNKMFDEYLSKNKEAVAKYEEYAGISFYQKTISGINYIPRVSNE